MNTPANSIEWPPPPDPPLLTNAEVHVWAAALNLPPARLATLTTTLSAPELARTAAFKLDQPRNRFVAARALLRDILARYVNVDPAALEFAFSNKGKPELAAPFRDTHIHFNLSHSHDIALVAVTRAGPVGIDVEHIRPIKNAAHLVARFFAPGENRLFQEIPTNRQLEAFFTLWTRKESFLKATGEGITGSLSGFEVSFLPGTSPRVFTLAGDTAKADAWSLHTLTPAPNCLGALAIMKKEITLRCWKWDDRQ